MLHVRMDSAVNADALGLYVYNIVVVSASCHYCCWLSFSEHVGFYNGRQLLPHFTHSVTADLSYWQLVCWQVRVMLRNCPWWHSSLCQWNKMYEMHHYSFSSRFRKCHVFSVYFMSKVWCQIVFFFARSVLCELASACHLAKLFLNCYVTYWLETGSVVLHNFFQVILLSCFFVKMLKLWSKWNHCVKLFPLTQGWSQSKLSISISSIRSKHGRRLESGFMSPKGYKL